MNIRHLLASILTCTFAMFALFSSSEAVYACQFHGAGFDASLWTERHSLSTRKTYDSFLPKKPANQSKIKLSLPPMIRAKVESDETFTVGYAAEGEDPVIEVQIDPGPGMTVREDTIKLAGKDGEHTFVLLPQTKGNYRLVVTARHLNNAELPVLKRAVYVNIYE